MIRSLTGALVTAACTAALVGAQAPAAPPADLVLFNGRVITVDRGFTIASAVAISGERFVAVGDDAAVRARAGSNARTIDLRGLAVIPGLMDNHLHGAGGGPGVDLSRARSLEDVNAAIRQRVGKTPSGEVIVSNSDWHEAQLKEQRLPLRDDLDLVAPAHPVVLIRGGHEYILNSAALTKWSIDEKSKEPEGGRLTRYPDGRLNGELVDTARAFVKLPPPPPQSLDQRIASHVADYDKLHAAGLTTVRHPGIPVDEYRLLEEMKRRGKLTMRINALLRPGGNAAAIEKALDASGLHQGDGDARLRIGGIKLAVDGGFEGGLMRAPYEEPWGEHGTFRGLQTMEREAFIDAVRMLNRGGWRVATHAVGDAAIDLVLDAYERAHQDHSIADRRWSIEHAFIGRADHLPRIKALGLAMSVQDHLYLAGPSLVRYWGRERAALTTPVRMYLDAGLPVSSGTDAPVVPYPPLWTLYHFVTRDTIAGGVLGPDQHITRQEALRIATMGNAWLMQEEADKGSIESGKLADLVVLSDDPLTAPETRLRDATVLLTMVGGKIVHDRLPR
ncbi:MAG TPA: amidohydrolase [Vicinamibacterales bacterium]|nr:amidohydrolase [Vicinamibacterales bacterium]